MTAFTYVPKRFRAKARLVVDQANAIIAEYLEQGLDLTLRQLFYRFVVRGWLANRHKEYTRLGETIGDARLAGLVDWDAIVDRTRRLRARPTWETGGDLLAAAAGQYRAPKWDTQSVRVEVWVEKDALSGVVGAICDELEVDYFACRGYASLTAMRDAGQRLAAYADAGQEAIVFYLGDHDPSGTDMTRDVADRLKLFAGNVAVTVKRLALTMPQIRELNLPPNLAKRTDSRAARYIAAHGDQSWELDALDPTTLRAVIREAVIGVRDVAAWSESVMTEKATRERLMALATDWNERSENQRRPLGPKSWTGPLLLVAVGTVALDTVFPGASCHC